MLLGWNRHQAQRAVAGGMAVAVVDGLEVIEVEREQGVPRNPFINAGALVVADERRGRGQPARTAQVHLDQSTQVRPHKVVAAVASGKTDDHDAPPCLSHEHADTHTCQGWPVQV